MPTVSGQSPQPGTTISPTTKISFTVTGADPYVLAAFFPDGQYEIIWDGTVFSPFYMLNSSRSGGGSVFTYTILRTGGWQLSPTITVAAVGVSITNPLGTWTKGSTTGIEDSVDLVTCAANVTTTIYTLPSPVIALGECVTMTAAIVADGIGGGAVGSAHWERRIVVKNVNGAGIQTADGTQLDTDVTASNTSNVSAPLAGVTAKIAVVGGTLAVQVSCPSGVSVNARCTVSADRSPGNTNVGVSWSMPGSLHMWRGDSFSVTGSNIDSIADAVGTATQTAGATKPTTTTLGSNSRAAATFITGSYFASSGGLAETMTSGAMFFVAKLGSFTAQCAIVNAGETGSPNVFEVLSRYDGTTQIRFDLDHGQTTPLTGGALTAGVMFDCLVTWDATHRDLYINGTLVVSATGALAPDTTVDKWVLGVLADLTTIPGSVDGLVLGEARIGNQRLTATDATNGHNYRTSYYA